LKWADAHFERTGKWPKAKSGLVHDAPGETWSGIETALQGGGRQLPGSSSVAKLLHEHREVRNRKNAPKLTEAQILAWADAHRERTREWPTHLSGSIPGQRGETWSSVNHALMRGRRGLPGGCSVADLLALHHGVRNVGNPPKLIKNQIIAWAAAHKARTGEWPRVLSGAILECPNETWRRIDNALRYGLRGLPGGSSLARSIKDDFEASTP